MKKYTTFLFDFDGTLLDSNAHVITCFKHAFREVCGIDLPQDVITATFGIPLEKALNNLVPAQAADVLRVYRAHSDALGFSKLREVQGARETLRALREKGCTVAVVTSKKTPAARAQMAHIGIADYVNLLVGPEATSAHKPDPAPVYYALEALGARAQDCLMIGDSPHDILCGKNAHVDTAGVRFTAVRLESLLESAPTYMISHLSELLEMAEGL